VSDRTGFPSAKAAANDPRILVFGRLLGAANGLEYLLGRSLEENVGITHSIYELLLLVGRAGDGGIALRDIAQSRVLTSGGATRLVQRAVADGLVTRHAASHDARVQLVELTPHGEEVVTRASDLHARNIETYLIDALPADQAEAFAAAVRTLSRNAARALPVMP